MAAPKLTPAAVEEIKRLVEASNSSRPVVIVIREGRKVEKRRGPNGETIWDVLVEGAWTVVVLDYNPIRDARTTKAYGLEFSDTFHEQLNDMPKLDFRDGLFVASDASI